MEGFLNPEEILKLLKLKETMIAADLGCGSGGWVIPLSKILEEGMVFAVDIQQEPLSALRLKAETGKLSNIRTIIADVEKGTLLDKESVDLVLITNLLFQCEKKEKVLEEGKRILKPKGRILVIEWKPNAVLGPKQGKITSEEIKEMAKNLGLRVQKEFDASAFHYGIILEK
jgi:ubiquinone/menaquinone biosynthesis C-methylase UbiE